ncbi:hypothetical protein M885DRAFT_541323 [Pelagophyceae sp. CCMP2097]|nr:hypothetical protein M885DRAFT_541323 [Pelagophyceae sp. CCMP2097]
MPPHHDAWVNDGCDDGCGSSARTVRLEFATGARVERVLDGVWFRCTVTDGYVEDDAAFYDVEYEDDGNREPDVDDPRPKIWLLGLWSDARWRAAARPTELAIGAR